MGGEGGEGGGGRGWMIKATQMLVKAMVNNEDVPKSADEKTVSGSSESSDYFESDADVGAGHGE